MFEVYGSENDDKHPLIGMNGASKQLVEDWSSL